MNDEPKSAKADDQLFLGVFKASPIGIALEDLEGRPLFANPALCSMLGYSEEEMRGKHCVEFSPPEDAQKDWALFEQVKAGTIDHYQLEKCFFRRDGSLIWGRLSISLVGSEPSRLVLAMVEDLSEKKTTKDKLLKSEAKGGKLERHLIQAQEDERTRIVQELHKFMDCLALISRGLDPFQQNPAQSVVETREEFRKARRQIEDLFRDIQNLSHRLRSPKLEYLGLAAAAGSFCEEFSEQKNIHIDIAADSVPKELPQEVSLALFHVLQEALQNAAEHSRSQRVEVLLACRANELNLIVRDWGVGFSPEEALKGAGLGLAIMKERLKLVNGELSIESERQRGTTVRAHVSLEEQSHTATAN